MVCGAHHWPWPLATGGGDMQAIFILYAISSEASQIAAWLRTTGHTPHSAHTNHQLRGAARLSRESKIAGLETARRHVPAPARGPSKASMPAPDFANCPIERMTDAVCG
eukprot:scaffold4145_cov115-Isochrysis_galbana.AAC.6